MSLFTNPGLYLDMMFIFIAVVCPLFAMRKKCSDFVSEGKCMDGLNVCVCMRIQFEAECSLLLDLHNVVIFSNLCKTPQKCNSELWLFAMMTVILHVFYVIPF